jgi:hypothetical protein
LNDRLRYKASSCDDGKFRGLFDFQQMAEDFFYGTKSEEEVMDFERRFIDNRRRAHELKIKAEKFHELMQASQATAYLHQYTRNSGYR